MVAVDEFFRSIQEHDTLLCEHNVRLNTLFCDIKEIVEIIFPEDNIGLLSFVGKSDVITIQIAPEGDFIVTAPAVVGFLENTSIVSCTNLSCLYEEVPVTVLQKVFQLFLNAYIKVSSLHSDMSSTKIVLETFCHLFFL